METFTSTPQYIGRTADNGRVYVTAKITHQRGDGFHTVDHCPAPAEIHRLSLTGEVYFPGHRGPTHHDPDPSMAGQIANILPMINRPAAGWDLDQIAELAAYWRRWHLNDMQAGCVHMEKFIPSRNIASAGDNWHIRPTCPITGYRWGNAWLVEDLPEAIANRIRGWFR